MNPKYPFLQLSGDFSCLVWTEDISVWERQWEVSTLTLCTLLKLV